MKYKDIDELMKSALASEEEPEEELNRRIMRKWRERPDMRKWTKRKMTVAVTAACVLLMSVTAGAAARYLTAGQLAERTGETKIAAAFKGDDAIEINETREAGNYRFTLLGIASGDVLVESAVSEAISDLKSTYVAIAIERIDGQPMPAVSDDAYGEESFFVSPLIQGLAPWQYNTASMNGGYTDTVVDGIHYRLLECDDVIKFADRKLYICISNTAFYDTMAYHYDENTGEITRNESYDGINVLFDFPVDASKADPAAAEVYLEELEESWKPAEDASGSIDDGNADEMAQINSLMDSGEIEKALEGAVLQEDSVKIVEEKNGRYEYEYLDSIYYFYKEDFRDGKDYMVAGSISAGDGWEAQTIYIITLNENGDGTVTIRTYEKTVK